jgi:hypothetical protein
MILAIKNTKIIPLFLTVSIIIVIAYLTLIPVKERHEVLEVVSHPYYLIRTTFHPSPYNVREYIENTCSLKGKSKSEADWDIKLALLI